MNEAPQRLEQVTEAFILVLCILLAVFAISEIVARQEVTFAAKERISEVAQDNVNVPERSITNRLEELRELKQLQQGVALLCANGTTDDQFTVAELRRRVANLQAPVVNVTVSTNSSLLLIFTKVQVLRYLDNEKILAILVISCGAIGALIAGLRTGGFTTFRDLTLGAATGFLTFLVVKGGKHLFLLQMDTGSLYFNPYSLALSGLLAGLFSERFYRLVSTLLDEFFARIRSALGIKADEPSAKEDVNRNDDKHPNLESDGDRNGNPKTSGNSERSRPQDATKSES